MATRSFCRSLSGFALALVAIANHGCGQGNAVVQPSAEKAKEFESRYPHDYLEKEDTVVVSGALGDGILASGIVLTPEGTSCPNAIVTLNQSSNPNRTHVVLVHLKGTGFQLDTDFVFATSDA